MHQKTGKAIGLSVVAVPRHQGAAAVAAISYERAFDTYPTLEASLEWGSTLSATAVLFPLSVAAVYVNATFSDAVVDDAKRKSERYFDTTLLLDESIVACYISF